MREALFIKKNKDRWLKNQLMPEDDPDEMAKAFTQLVDDLAYAKTFYPQSKVTKYINALAAKRYLDIYQNRREDAGRLITFWKYDLPLTIYKRRKVIFFTFIFFLLFFAIGFFSSSTDEDIAATILGQSYIDTTIENIENGNPFGIYEYGNPFFSWVSLMIHNIRVGLLCFTSGIFSGIGSLWILSSNAVMVGVFDQFFAARGLGLQFFLVVFVHGTIEITSIILSAAAGVIMGTSFLFPGSIKRVEALKRGAKDGVKIMIGLVPLFALAAFFEGFITRLYNDLSVITSGITFLSVLFVIGYFVIYPFYLVKKSMRL